ncbi:MAG: dethiobiotin synthase [Nitrospirota bacterium]|nr:dethiobiotin synthase [Nitrospirota bacterium]
MIKHKGIFITGTDTGVGKTYVACGVASELRRIGVDVGVMKPAESGCRSRRGSLIPADAISLAKAADAADHLDLINPYRFREPLAPAVAARLERKRIDLNVILRSFQTLATNHDFMLVEGAGGIMVPLTRRLTFLDLAVTIGLPVLIVARPNLGTINHTLLTVEALRQRSVPILGISINDSSGNQHGLAEHTSPSVIARMSGVSVLENIGFGQKVWDRLARSVLR